MNKLKEFFKEAFWEAAKHMVTLGIISSMWGIGSGLDDLKKAENSKKCKYESVWHYHPAKYLICKIMEEK